MRPLDWVVMVLAVLSIVLYGVWKGRRDTTMAGYLLAGRELPWYAVALSVMATQASAVTFLSAPGQAFVDGMRYVQIYMGLPIAMVIICITVVPLYHRLQVYTAYEFLETRFDLKVRSLAALLFLAGRSLAAGISIFAPALIISTILEISLSSTIVAVGVAVITYTTLGGSRAVSWTQFHQMLVITVGMIAAFITLLYQLPDHVSLLDATRIAGSMGRLNVMDFRFDMNTEFNFWSGLLGGTFLALSYFGTDQSQVQRYLAGSSVGQMRRGLLFNAAVKIPMQFAILFLGAMVFVFYQFSAPPLFFNRVDTQAARESEIGAEIRALENDYETAFESRRQEVEGLLSALDSGDSDGKDAARARLIEADQVMVDIREEAIGVMVDRDPEMNPQDRNYIFLTFVIDHLPVGLVGLLFAAILFAAMSSASSELNALASTTVIDVYRRILRKEASDAHYVAVSKLATVFWGLAAILFGETASRLGSLIVAVNLLGSIFYGTILGIFLLAFYAKKVSSNATFIAALIAEATIIAVFSFADIAFLWWNVIGCALCVGLALALDPFVRPKLIGEDANVL